MLVQDKITDNLLASQNSSASQLFELKFANVNVTAQVNEEVETDKGQRKKIAVKKTILQNCSGTLSPYTFTTIVGPSGCGKTTLLNLLSGRLLSSNLTPSGELYVNQQPCQDINKYADLIGYVMQEDVLMATFSPRESFKFIADLRLTQHSSEEKCRRVEQVIQSLGLTYCSDTWIGNHLIRGISGGQKKRVSIGVELLVSPSIIFLDEPTTGLDSKTALNVISYLDKLAKAGRTIVSTIHQPSSQIFAAFDRLMIMVQGNIVYEGTSRDSINYFEALGFTVPLRSNPTDYYMKIMNKEGIAQMYIERDQDFTDEQVAVEFAERVEFFKTKYSRTHQKYISKAIPPLPADRKNSYLPFFNQLALISRRTFVNQLRNPLNLRLRFVQIMVQALLCILLFYKQGHDFYSRVQNTSGVVFYLLSVEVFGGFASNLSSFNTQRPIFIRERISNYYSSGTYFWGRAVALQPVELFLPLFKLSCCYFLVHLDNSKEAFFWTLLIMQLAYFMSASYALLISTLVKDLKVAFALFPILLVPLMLVGGLFQDINGIPKVFLPLQYVSMFKYGYQASIQVQFANPVPDDRGVLIDLLRDRFRFPDPFWINLMLMGVIGVLFRILGYFAMQYVSNPKRVKLQRIQNLFK